MTRVAYIGNFRHAHCTEVLVARAFEECGVTVDRLQQESVAPETLLTVRPYDLVLYTRTHNGSALGPAWSDVWRDLERRGAVTASLHLDRFFDLDRERLVHEHDPLFTAGFVFTADGGNQDRFAAAGVNHYWMPPAVDRETVLGAPYVVPSADVPPVLFVGSGGYHREYPARDDLLRFLTGRYGPDFCHVGPGSRHGTIRDTKALTALYRGARVVIGDSCFANEPGCRSDRYWSDRIPETIGRGGLLAHPDVPGLAETGLVAADHFLAYTPGDWQSLTALIDQAAHPLFADVAERGRLAVLAGHTWTHRARLILNVCVPLVGDGPKIENVEPEGGWL